MSIRKSTSFLNFTGERIVTEINEYWTLEHLHRYAFVKELIKGKNVVDIASGEGYGSNLLAEYAHSVIGIDISEEAIEHSNRKYVRPNLEFIKGSAIDMRIPDSSVDVLVSFETIEHHDEHDKMMQEISRVLKDDGVLVISSPDKKNYSDKTGYNNPYHVKELYLDEFEGLIKKYFPHTVMLYQKTAVASLMMSSTRNNKIFKEFSGNYEKIEENDRIQNAVYNICIASLQPVCFDLICLDSFFSNQELNDFYFKLKEKYDVLKVENEVLSRQVGSFSYRIGRIISSPIRFFKKN